jgi:hypothetical protein
MKNLLICTFLAALLASCKNNANEPKNDVTLAGRIELVDSTNIMLTDFSGAIVSVDNTNLTTTTDSFGHWQIQNVPESEHNITATKAGFGTFHWYQQTFAGGEYDLQTVVFGRLPNVTPIIDSAVTNVGGIYCEVNASSLSGHSWPVQFYLDLDSSTQPEDPHTIIPVADIGSVFFSMNSLHAAGIHSGQTVYLSASLFFSDESAYSGGTDCQYYDPVNHQWQFASTGPKSNVLKVVIP